MFGRVAASGIAALLFIMPVPSNGADSAAGDMDKSAGDAVILDPSGQTGVLSQQPAPQQTQDDSGAQTKVSALDPASPDSSPSLSAPSIPAPSPSAPFGRNLVPAFGGNLLTKWSGVEAAIRAESEIFSRCKTNAALCPAAARNFLAIVAQGRAATGRARLGVINRAVNMAIIPTSDLEQWGVIDRWSPPLETFTTSRGDCEDYAIAKYVALLEAGVDAQDVKLVIVRNLAAGEDHAVVAARLEGNWIILDNRWLALVHDSEMSQVVPLFVLDQSGVWQFAPASVPEARPASTPSDAGATAPGSLPH